MHAAAHGRDERPVVTYSEPQSISRETTFERDLSAKRDRALLSSIFTELCAGVGDDLWRKGYAGRTIGIKLRYDDFRTVTRDRTIAEATQDAAMIRRVAADCVRRVPLERRIRLFGVRVGGLVRIDTPAMTAREARTGDGFPLRLAPAPPASRRAHRVVVAYLVVHPCAKQRELGRCREPAADKRGNSAAARERRCRTAARGGRSSRRCRAASVARARCPGLRRPPAASAPNR